MLDIARGSANFLIFQNLITTDGALLNHEHNISHPRGPGHLRPGADPVRGRGGGRGDHPGRLERRNGVTKSPPPPDAASPTEKSTGQIPRTQCEWALDSDPDMDVWHTECGQLWEFNEGGPTDNSMKFCPF